MLFCIVQSQQFLLCIEKKFFFNEKPVKFIQDDPLSNNEVKNIKIIYFPTYYMVYNVIVIYTQRFVINTAFNNLCQWETSMSKLRVQKCPQEGAVVQFLRILLAQNLQKELHVVFYTLFSQLMY